MNTQELLDYLSQKNTGRLPEFIKVDRVTGRQLTIDGETGNEVYVWGIVKQDDRWIYFETDYDRGYVWIREEFDSEEEACAEAKRRLDLAIAAFTTPKRTKEDVMRIYLCKEHSVSEKKAIDIVNKLIQDKEVFEDFCEYIRLRKFGQHHEAVEVNFHGMTAEKLVNIYGFTIVDAYLCMQKLRKKKGYLRVISDGIRFGCGLRFNENCWQFFAWYGYPNRNDDYIITTEISQDEFKQINIDYPKSIVANEEEGKVFNKKCIEGHKVLLEEWNKHLV